MQKRNAKYFKMQKKKIQKLMQSLNEKRCERKMS